MDEASDDEEIELDAAGEQEDKEIELDDDSLPEKDNA